MILFAFITPNLDAVFRDDVIYNRQATGKNLRKRKLLISHTFLQFVYINSWRKLGRLYFQKI